MTFPTKIPRMIPQTALACLLALGITSGCAHPAQRQIEGRWLGTRVENVDDRMLAAASGWVRGTSFEFVGSRVTVAIPAEEPRTGDYEVLHADEVDLVVAVHDENDAVYEARFERESEHELRWDVGDGRAVVLKREL